ncbi:MAG: response regulator [bacterium]
MGRKLLVIDDDPAVRGVIRRVLQEAGLEVIEAADGRGVADLVRRERPALALLDIHMPHLDGIAALSEILDAAPGMAVVMVSGDDDLRLAKMAMDRGACDHLTKPLDLRSLRMSVKAYMPDGASR